MPKYSSPIRTKYCLYEGSRDRAVAYRSHSVLKVFDLPLINEKVSMGIESSSFTYPSIAIKRSHKKLSKG